MRVIRRLLVGFVAVFLAAFIAIGGSQSALAQAPPSDSDGVVTSMTAHGTTAIDTFSYSFGGVSINVPAGCFFTHSNIGDGGYVENEYAGFDCIPPASLVPGLFCNYQVEFVYTNNETGAVWQDNRSPLTSGCNTYSDLMYNPSNNFTIQAPSSNCAKLWVNGEVRAEQCHAVF